MLQVRFYVCCVYFSPGRNSFYNANSNNGLFEQTGVDMSQYCKHGNILICGDLNVPHFILNDESSYIPFSENYLQDTNLHCRISQDNLIDARGWELLGFCIKRQLCIYLETLNGCLHRTNTTEIV